MNVNETILNTVFKALDELNEQLTKSTKTVLFGNNGQLDSLGLVNLLVIIEQNIEDEFDVNITIADERAMSQKHSPFRTIGTLVDYIDMLLKEIQNSE
jgi:D-alanine--poly(phosphoribitol) ligase subunit 2